MSIRLYYFLIHAQYMPNTHEYRLAAKPELAEKFYFHYKRQESEQRPAKQAFGRANSGLVFRKPGSLICTVSLSFICFMRINHFPDSIGLTIQYTVLKQVNMQNMHYIRWYVVYA